MARKVILYISVSLDGYIADQYGSVSQLVGKSEEYSGDYGYEEFISGTDTILMGMNTYRQITEELSPDTWPYPTLKSYVFTHKEMDDQRGIAFIQRRPEKFLAELKAQSGKHIWVCGGSNLANQLIGAGMIYDFHLHIMPVVLGGGIPLFDRAHPNLRLCIENVKETNGVIDITYSCS